MKTCPDCQSTGPFGAKNRYCRPCENSRQKARNATPEGKARTMRAKRLKLYGLSDAAYTRMLTEQEGLCAICRQPPTGRSGPLLTPREALCVDHCHDTGRVRGLLCSGCNTILALAKDNPITLTNARFYLDERA